MSIQKEIRLRIYPDSVLRDKSSPVKNINGETHEFIKDMRDLMYSYEGIGLAAPQVGILQRIIIADNEGETLTLINPKIIEENGEDALEEGCLSLPGIWLDVNRSETIVVQDIYPDGKERRRKYSGLIARIIKHEIDHLNGILILDYASTLEKYMINKKLKNKSLKF
jgi:peptide deformylase